MDAAAVFDLDRYEPLAQEAGVPAPRVTETAWAGRMADAPGETLWMRWALCRDRPEVNFHPNDGDGVQHAVAVCAGCPVCAECLDYAMRHNEDYGIWGGHSERSRRRLRRVRRMRRSDG